MHTYCGGNFAMTVVDVVKIYEQWENKKAKKRVQLEKLGLSSH
jgi:hypothetical protein